MVLFFGTYFALGTFTHLVSPGVGLSLNTSNFIVICGYASSPTNASALLPLMSLTAQMLFHCVLWISLGGLIAIASAGSLVSLAIPYFVVSSAGPLLRLSDGFSASFFTNNCYQSDPQQQTIFQSLAVYYTLEAVALVAAAIYLRSIYLTGKLRLR
jgi:hypothetical protein